MRRPLAFFGLCFFFAMLVAVRLPAAALWAAALGFAAAFLVVLFVLKRRARAMAAVAAASVFCALVCCGLYNQLAVRPVAALAGATRQVTARVVDVQPGYTDGTVHATAEILSAEQTGLAGFRVVLRGIPVVEIGDVLAAQLRFEDFSTAANERQNYARGYYISAAAKGAPQVTGSSHTFETRMRAFQYAASANIRGRMPLRLSAVAAAMSVGDRRFLPADTADAYRAAGISHMLVVSGLHLSLLCAFLFPLLAGLTKRRRLAAGLCMGFVALFIAFTGFTPSIVRSGTVFLVLYGALLFSRKSDIFTSMGAALLVLLVLNPYACNDVGLQLSFTATLGAVWGGSLTNRLRTKRGDAPKQSPLRGALRTLAQGALVPCCVTAATLPVLASAGMALSLATVPLNLIAVPLLTPIVLCGLLMAIPPFIPVLGWLGLPATLVCGTLLSFLDWLTGLCASIPRVMLPLGGAFMLVVILAVYAVVYIAYKTGRLRLGAILSAALLCIALALHLWLDAGTVRISLAGTGPTASVVITQNGQSVVLYRGRQSVGAVVRLLKENNSQDCVLLIDMRKTAEGTEYQSLVAPEESVLLFSDIAYRAAMQPLASVRLSVVRQANGAVVCIDIDGYKIGVCNGGVNLGPYAPLDVLIPGSSAVQGAYASILSAGAQPEWAEPGIPVLLSQGEATLWVRPGQSITFREVFDGIHDG